MAAVTIPDSRQKSIDVYLLAAPEDQAVSEEIVKHLGPIIKNCHIPITVNSDFNIPPGTEKEQHKALLLEAEIVLALISVDFINNDEIQARNDSMIERYNRGESVMIPVLVRNCMWKATPFSKLKMVPKNLQPLNNRQFWNSPDDAVMEVVNDINDSINELARMLREAAAEASIVQPDLAAAPDMPAIPLEEPPQGGTVEPPAAAEMSMDAAPAATMEASLPQAVPDQPLEALPQSESPAAREPSTAEAGNLPAVGTVPETTVRAARVSAKPAVQIDHDWRRKYYRTVLLKRLGAILLDQIILVGGPFILLIFVAEDLAFFVSPTMYFVVIPWMESSKWQGTVGKRIMGLQITNREGERISFLRSLWRNLMRTATLYSYFLPAVLIFIYFDVVPALVLGSIPAIYQYFRFKKTRKLFHDELSGTVIGERLAGPNTIGEAPGLAGSAS